MPHTPHTPHATRRRRRRRPSLSSAQQLFVVLGLLASTKVQLEVGWAGVGCSGVGWVELGRTAVVDGNHAKTCPPRVVEGNGTSLFRLFVTLSRWPN